MGQNFYQMYGGSGAHMQGSLPDFGGSIDRGSFPFFMGGGYVGPYFVEARSSNEGFDFIQQFLDLHIAREARVDFDGRF